MFSFLSDIVDDIIDFFLGIHDYEPEDFTDEYDDPDVFSYDYDAVTSCNYKNHSYSFSIEKYDGTYYRCYVLKQPSFRGRDTTDYIPHLWTNGAREWICWTGNIEYPEQAKTLCRKWADATQAFIDTGVPLPAFTKQ